MLWIAFQAIICEFCVGLSPGALIMRSIKYILTYTELYLCLYKIYH